ncbi:MAG: hypothetical protein WB392_03485 [Methanotrichaceae archaeon]
MIEVASIGTINCNPDTIANLGGYNFTFEMNRPHEVSGATVKTFDGFIFLGITNNATQAGFTPEKFIGYTMVGKNIALLYKTGYGYLDNSGYSALFSTTLPPRGPHNIAVLSTLNLTDTIDFLRSLKIEPANLTKKDPMLDLYIESQKIF